MRDLGPIEFSPGGEEWLEYTAAEGRRRVGFHDYAAIYREPGLYERVFYDELGMCSTAVVVELVGEVLQRLGRDPAGERVLDLGAGNGRGGDELRALGIGTVVGLDLEPEARAAALRDRPGTYDDYLAGDLLDDAVVAALREHRPTIVVALAAIGVGHIPPAALDRALDLLDAGDLFAFAVTPALLPGSTDPEGRATGYPDRLGELLTGELARRTYVHRRQTDGTPHDAVAVVARRQV